METKKQVPAVRFKGFYDDWNEKKLGKIGDTYTGLSGKTKNDFGHGNGRFVTYMNVFSNPISNRYQVEPIEIDVSQNEVKTGDVFFTTSSETPEEVGMSSVWLGDAQNIYLNSFCFGYRTVENFDNFYLASLLRSPNLRKKIRLLAQGISRYNISKNKVMEIAVPIPDISEQTQIGSYFKQLDEQIRLQEQKHNKLTQLNRTMLEKMFPKAGTYLPEIRFKGFTEKWGKNKLRNLCQIGDIDHRMPKSVLDGIPYLMTGDFVGINGLNFKNVKLISKEDFDKLSRKIKPEKGDILIARYASVGAVRYVETKVEFLISYSCAILKHNESINSKYLYYYLKGNEAQRQIELDINSGSQRNIGIDSLNKLTISLAEKNEQEVIAKYFDSLDKLTLNSQLQLDKLKNIKQSLLDKMFI